MYYISAASTISHQPTFQNEGFSALIEPLQVSSVLISPDYKSFIDAGLLRRMSKILRMSVACAKDCLGHAAIEQPGAIIVGTGLGCLTDTEKFLNNVLTIEGLLPPTAFIQSTHNTMAGQISLSIGNHGYNMTHTQNSLSFEHALLDAMLVLDEGEKNVLVGAADETIDFLVEVASRLHFTLKQETTSGTSFFVISGQQTDQALACIQDVRTTGLVPDVKSGISTFLAANETALQDLDLVLFAGPLHAGNDLASALFQDINPAKTQVADYIDLSGIYPTASAFAMHYAADRMKADAAIKKVLICNTLIQSNLGLILLHAIEA